MKLLVGVQILEKRSYDALDGDIDYQLYSEAAQIEETSSDFVAHDDVESETVERVELIRKNFAEVWIWQFTNMRWVLAVKHKA